MITDKHKREFRELIKALNREAERLERECADLDAKTYQERQQQITSIELKKNVLTRRLSGDIPQGINQIKPITNSKHITYE